MDVPVNPAPTSAYMDVAPTLSAAGDKEEFGGFGGFGSGGGDTAGYMDVATTPNGLESDDDEDV